MLPADVPLSQTANPAHDGAAQTNVHFDLRSMRFCRVHEQYEKAAVVLRKHDLPVVLAKVDAYDEMNKEIKDKYQVHAYPTIKIIENGGNNVRGYGGPRDADGIVEYLKKQVGPASIELRSAEEAAHAIGDKGVVLVCCHHCYECPLSLEYHDNGGCKCDACI